VAALIVTIELPRAVIAGPNAGVNVTSLPDAVASKPVPVMLMGTAGEAPDGVTAVSVPAITPRPEPLNVAVRTAIAANASIPDRLAIRGREKRRRGTRL
jgi:hypothetical protein